MGTMIPVFQSSGTFRCSHALFIIRRRAVCASTLYLICSSSMPSIPLAFPFARCLIATCSSTSVMGEVGILSSCVKSGTSACSRMSFSALLSFLSVKTSWKWSCHCVDGMIARVCCLSPESCRVILKSSLSRACLQQFALWLSCRQSNCLCPSAHSSLFC